jgi:hypothetical protein
LRFWRKQRAYHRAPSPRKSTKPRRRTIVGQIAAAVPRQHAAANGARARIARAPGIH